jgi:TRAP transporter TAXI family solute receptor
MMGKRTTSLAAGFVAVLAVAAVAAPTKASAADIFIGTGISSKVHYDVSRAICRHVQRVTNQLYLFGKKRQLTCEALAIEGRHAAEPIAILSDVRNGSIEFGLVQSDWQYYAVQGSGPLEFTDVKFENIRALFSLHSEPFTVVARRDSGIDALSDLEGKRVNIGNPGSNQRAVMESVMNATGWTRGSFQLADELTESEQSLALCHNRVQAVVATVAHPNQAIAKAIELCDANIVDVVGPAVDKLVADNRFFTVAEIPGGLYAGMERPAKTFGVTLTVVGSADMDDDLVYTIVKTVFDNLNDFKRLHPALGNLIPGRMMTDGLSAPLHPGALQYYRESGMM